MKVEEVIVVAMVCSLHQCFCIDANNSPHISWGRSGVLTHQSVHSILASLEDKLRTLDSIRYNAARWEMSMDTLARRLETLDERVRRSQTAMELKMESLSQTIVSCELKDELSRDQLSRKFESSQERLIHRLGYVESRLDTAINKLQGSMEMSLGKLETKEADIGTELSDISTTVEEIKLNSIAVGERLNHTHQIITKLAQNIKSEVASHHQADRITHILHGIQKHVNKSTVLLEQNDGPNLQVKDNADLIDSLKGELGMEVHKIGNKVSNMYNDLWRKFITIEDLVRNAINVNNHTRKEFQEYIRTFVMENRDAEASDNFIEVAVDSLASIIQRKLNDLNRKMDNNFERVVTAQTMFMDTCHRLQDDEPQLEIKISLVLEKILDTIINRTSNVDKQLIEIMEGLKAHNSQVIRTVAHNNNMVTTLAEESSQDNKHLGSTLFDINNKADAVANSLQILQEIVHETMNITALACTQNIEEIIGNVLQYEKMQQCRLCEENSKQGQLSEAEIKVNGSAEKELEQEKSELDNTLHLIEAHYNQGVIKIFTENNEQQNRTPGEITNLNNTHTLNTTSHLDIYHIPLHLLNKSINVDSLTAIVHEPLLKLNKSTTNEKSFNYSNPTNINVYPENLDTINSSTANETHLDLLKIIQMNTSADSNRTDTEKRQELEIGSNEIKPKQLELQNGNMLPETTAIQILMTYLKVVKGHMTMTEFLQQANPNYPYDGLQEMIKDLKGSKFIPTEFLGDLEKWDSSSAKVDKQQPKGSVPHDSHEDYNFTSYEDYESESIL